MSGTDESPARAESWADDDDDDRMRDSFRPSDDFVQQLTVERAVAFVARALQDHHLKVDGAADYMADPAAIFEHGTSVMAMVTKESREKEYQGSKDFGCSQESLTWYIKGGEVYLWCTKEWQSVTIGGTGFEIGASSRSRRTSQPQGPTYKVGDKVLVPVPGMDDFVLCQVTAICV